MPDLESQVFTSIDDIDPALWNSMLQPGEFLASHDFVRACEKAGIGGAEFRYVLVFERGCLIGSAALFNMRVGLDLLAAGLTRSFFDVMRRVNPSLASVSVVFCGLPVSLGTSCVRLAHGHSHDGATSLITAVMKDFAEDSGAGFLCFKEFGEQESRALGPALTTEGFTRASSLPGCSVDIRWPDRTQYEDALRSGYRRQLQLDRQAMRESGLEFAVGQGLLPDLATVHQLYSLVMARAQNKMEILPVAFFSELEKAAPGKLWSVVAHYEGRPVANAIVLWDKPVCYFLLAGLDYAHLGETHTYQNLVSEVIGTAISLGASHLELGQTSYALKGRLGGKTTSRDIWLRHLEPLRNRLLAAAAPLLFHEVRPPVRHVFRRE